MRSLLLAPLCLLLLLRLCDDWRDPQPGTVRLNASLHGQPASCTALLFAADGRQLREYGVNEGSLVIDKLLAGDYTLRFRDHAGKSYPAELRFRIFEAGELKLQVELSEAPTGTSGTSVSSG